METVQSVPSLTRLFTLGRGSTATVSLASDHGTGHLFAIKSAELSLASQLQREHRILSSLSSPYINSCYGSYTANSQYHLLLELATGGSLFDRIKSHSEGRLDEQSIRSYAKDILLGLSYLHSHSISHGDIKSQNILIDSDGRAKIADFGTAMLLGETQDEKLSPLSGTPAFMAPEVARGEERGTAADIWALGCTVIEMATGNAPWHGIIKEQDVLAAVYQIGFCSDSMPPIPDWISDEGKDFLLNCLKRDPTERWSAEKLLNHPFVRLCETGLKRNGSSISTFSPQSALDFGLVFHDSETESDEDDEEDDETGSNASQRIRELAGFGFESSMFDWESSEDGWIEVRSSNSVENGECESRDQVEFLGYGDSSDLLMSTLDLNFDELLDKTSEEDDCFLQSNYDFNVCKANLNNKAVNSVVDQTICVLSVSSCLLLVLLGNPDPSCLLQNSSLVVNIIN